MLLPHQHFMLARDTKDKEHAMSQNLNTAIAVVGIDIGKNSFHIVGQDERGTIVLHQKWSRGHDQPPLSGPLAMLVARPAAKHFFLLGL